METFFHLFIKIPLGEWPLRSVGLLEQRGSPVASQCCSVLFPPLPPQQTCMKWLFY